MVEWACFFAERNGSTNLQGFDRSTIKFRAIKCFNLLFPWIAHIESFPSAFGSNHDHLVQVSVIGIYIEDHSSFYSAFQACTMNRGMMEVFNGNGFKELSLATINHADAGPSIIS